MSAEEEEHDDDDDDDDCSNGASGRTRKARRRIEWHDVFDITVDEYMSQSRASLPPGTTESQVRTHSSFPTFYCTGQRDPPPHVTGQRHCDRQMDEDLRGTCIGGPEYIYPGPRLRKADRTRDNRFGKKMLVCAPSTLPIQSSIDFGSQSVEISGTDRNLS
jgi:hypothetical protein